MTADMAFYIADRLLPEHFSDDAAWSPAAPVGVAVLTNGGDGVLQPKQMATFVLEPD